jgi:hypothetical protein
MVSNFVNIKNFPFGAIVILLFLCLELVQLCPHFCISLGTYSLFLFSFAFKNLVQC